MASSYYRWSTTDDITLFLQLVSPSQSGSPGGSPEVAIRRVRATHGGALDGWYWDGVSAFTNVPTWLPLVESDAVNQPGLYSYLFAQSAVASEWVYLMYYRHTVAPFGFCVEEHFISDEIYVPVASPAVPVIPGDTVLGRLSAMESSTGVVASANSDAVWDEVLSQHLTPGTTGAALAACSSAHVGAYQIDITVEDNLANPIQGCQVDIYDASNSNFITRVHTDVNGQANVALDASAYSVRLFATGYAFTVPEALVVTADASITFSGTSFINITPPSAPDLCVIFGTVRNAAGRNLSGVCVEAYATTPQVVAGTQKGEKIASVRTDANGYFELELVRGTEVNFEIEDTDFDKVLTVPDQASQDVTTWT